MLIKKQGCMPIVLPVKNLKNTIAKAKMSMERPSWTIQVVWPEEPLTGLSFSWFFCFFFNSFRILKSRKYFQDKMTVNSLLWSYGSVPCIPWKSPGKLLSFGYFLQSHSVNLKYGSAGTSMLDSLFSIKVVCYFWLSSREHCLPTLGLAENLMR